MHLVASVPQAVLSRGDNPARAVAGRRVMKNYSTHFKTKAAGATEPIPFYPLPVEKGP
jgi:hypothetical protein